MIDKEILVISFGTTYMESCEKGIGAIERAIASAFPDYVVRRAFTSGVVSGILKEKHGVLVDSVEEALERAFSNGIKTIIAQPTHIMNGREYNKMLDIFSRYKNKFDKIAIGAPLLTYKTDFNKVAKAIADYTQKYNNGSTAVCLMGHGTDVEANSVYRNLQKEFHSLGFNNYFVGTVEAEPSVCDLVSAVNAGHYKKVVLEPFMVVSGDHANNDMAGDDEFSWKNRFKKAGYNLECVLKGIGEIETIQNIYVEHAGRVINGLE